MSLGYRSLTAKEQAALQKLLSVEAEGNAALRFQGGNLLIKKIDDTLFFLRTRSTLQKEDSKKTYGLPVEGVYQDKDGAIVYVWLFVDQDNVLAELEIWRPDGNAVITNFADADLVARAIEQ